MFDEPQLNKDREEEYALVEKEFELPDAWRGFSKLDICFKVLKSTEI